MRLAGAAIGGRRRSRADFALRCDSDAAGWALIRAGAGIGLAHVPVAAGWSGVVRVLPGVAVTREVWLAMHADLARARPVRALWSWRAEALSPALSGTTAPRA